MREWRQIKSAIYDALSNYDCDVYYNPPTGRGYNACCSYFTITINEDCDHDFVADELDGVCDDWELSYDWDSEDGDLDLNADWDRND